jgi:hypothetical protein
LKKRGSAPGPCFPLSGLFCLDQHDQSARQFIGAERICPGSDDQLAELPHFAALDVARLVPKCLQFGIEIAWLAH